MNQLTIFTELAAASGTGEVPEWWHAPLLVTLAIAGLAVVPIRWANYRWKVHRGRRHAPSTDIQEAQIRAILDGRPLVTLDPRDFTLTVARINRIANEFGYHYVNECGNRFGSTRVDFQRLPEPPPPRIPHISRRRTQGRAFGSAGTNASVYLPPENAENLGTHWDPETIDSIRMFASARFTGADVVRVRKKEIEPHLGLATMIAREYGYVFGWSHIPQNRTAWDSRPEVYHFRRLHPIL
ncbi:MAG TPA: hypothetical protein VFN32_03800 [Rhodococcus sp. (in: high G+C Gram-positive bacteria)]|uniref:hypothetical protein n=1 Tax=Rhodococcus sp. SJ-3 TaxID=3454628 RepID=UPI002DAE905E|nr:hypothetical protein [Rhodococcus sp. (in: high G+C Gram-positive bacteria)]